MCLHENQVDDEREGNVVCTDCGLVLAPIYLYPNIFVKNKNINKPFINKKNQIFTTSIKKQTNCCSNLKNETIELDILCNKLQFYTITKTRVLEKWELIKKWFFKEKFKDRKNPHVRKGLIVMTIYQTLNELDIPRPMSHLCQDAGIAPKYVWYWMKLFYKDKSKEHKDSILNPSSMSEYFLNPLNLSYNELKEINKIVQNNAILTFSPKTLLASCAYMYLRSNNKQCLSVKNLAKLLGISVMSIYRCLKTINHNAQQQT